MKMNKKAFAVLSAGHLITDINQGAPPVLLLYFKEALTLSYTRSGVIPLSANLASPEVLE
jgi:MFS transporter, FSR family, fosmidomycin resistance protein